ncbi:MAG TPA: response regulator, partial [Candidatus Dormibacteraeota bacterium]|nr:response regulator [Candidatus Dormibacteraeota bacterium]
LITVATIRWEVRRKLKMLVAEDNPQDRELIQLAVKRGGVAADVYEVEDGEQLLEYLRGENGFQDRARHPLPDLLLIDLKMPRVDGLAVLKWLQQHPECNRLPKVMLSGSGLEKDVEEAYKRGVNTYFAKPSSFREFQELLKVLVDYWSRSQAVKVGNCR